jgi:hypothetical protein
MKVETLANQNVPNGTASEVTLFKDISKDIICFKNKNGVIIPLGGGGLVFDGLTATGTSQATTKTTLNYGINVFTTITPTNFCARLPIANTGQVVTVVNNTTSTLTLHPSVEGGSINNTVNGIASVPPDGKAYNFYCIKNPLPGAWTWNPPAVGQFVSDDITISVSSGTGYNGNNPFISAYNNTVKNILTGYTSINAGYDGKNKGLIQGSAGSPDAIYFKPASSWNSAVKIKVYTNATAPSYVSLIANGEIDSYDIATNGIVNNGASVGGALAWMVNINTLIAGTPLNAGYIQPYIGAPGTRWGEYTFPTSILATSNNSPFTSSVIGDQDFGNQLFTGTMPPEYIGQLVNMFYSCYLSFQMQPMYGVAYGANQDFQFKFIIEHT